MCTSTLRSWFPLILIAVVSACGYPRAGAAPGPVTADDVQHGQMRWPGTSAESLEHGRQIFLAHCNNCHSYPDREAIADARWPSIVDRMANKAHLTPPEHDAVLQYIQASRSTPPSSGSP